MKLVFADTSVLQKSVKILAVLGNDVIFDAGEDALFMYGLDPAKVCWYEFRINSSACIEYKHDEEDEPFSVNVQTLSKILKLATSSDVLELKIENEKLLVRFKGTNKSEFKLSIEDNTMSPMEITKAKNHVRTLSNSFKEAVERCELFSDKSIEVEINNERLKMSSTDEINDVEIILNEADTKIESEGRHHKSRYGVEFLSAIKSAATIFETIDLWFGTDTHLRAEFKDPEKYLLSFTIAPRVEDD
jgi:DNA polymerase III sliding clamp (beta) subunit (PCNA family)